ncbi:MAG: PhzF family phenazine biosynthesis protein [Maribacter sp.]|nr:PhzF family phenazine biosynthesis protein [Maribacter sp.]
MKLKIFQIDAFADTVFSGNPAAVCIMDTWLDASLMQQIAAENNLAETAFVVKDNGQYHIRWFTPEIEVDLCGHATLASAFVLFKHYILDSETIEFYSHRSGPLTVEKGKDGNYIMDFPVDNLEKVEAIPAINKAIGIEPKETYKGKTDYLLIYNSQKTIEEINPNFFLLDQVDARGVIVSAKGEDVDFVSRFFAPQCGISEDPVTGSAHTTLTPYWSQVLGKKVLYAKQLSKRGGQLICEDHGERIIISGKAVAYLEGEIEL